MNNRRLDFEHTLTTARDSVTRPTSLRPAHHASHPGVVLVALASLVTGARGFADAQTDRDRVLGVIATMFDGLAARDTAVMRSVIDGGARLVQTFNTDSGPAVRSVPIASFLDRIGDTSGPPIEERYWDPEVRIHDNLATVWISYVFLVSGDVSHCGEDTFQLARRADGWKIIALADTQRRQGCQRNDVQGTQNPASGPTAVTSL